MTESKRTLGLDYGSTRIGLALSDPLQIIATPYVTIENTKRCIFAICTIIDQENVGTVVVGLPLNLKGEKGKKAEEVDKFIVELAKATTAKIVQWDERFTSSIAQQTLLAMGTKRSERRTNKGRVDSMAAAIILQGYLDSQKRSLVC